MQLKLELLNSSSKLQKSEKVGSKKVVYIY